MKKGLYKSIFIIMLLLVTLFSFSIKSNAASFAYKDFDWDEFLKQNKNYWVSNCKEDDDDCVDEVLATKKSFYTRLYELLYDVEKKGYGHIDDNYIIATVYFGLDPDSFRDPLEGEDNPYNVDENEETKNKYVGTYEDDSETVADYFKKETDTLKTLVNSFIGYTTKCLADTGEIPQEYKNEDGTTSLTCSSNEYEIMDNKCLAVAHTVAGNFFDSIGINSLGNDTVKKCEDKISEMGLIFYGIDTSNNKEVNNKFFFNFLESTEYFDRKSHLRSYYSRVLSNTDYKTMVEFYDKATDEEKKKFESDIKKSRQRIIDGIKSVIDAYGEENFSKVSSSFSSANSKKYWWPIGSDETTEVDGVLYASDSPSKTSISSNFGFRVDPVSGERNSIHNGIDIPGELGVTNVIASKDGIISNVVTECIDGGDQKCGGGFGNHIRIQHVDGNYTIYAHLFKGSINLKIGDSVKQGQIIGKVGNSGKSTGAHLHFEVRVGGDDSTSAQDPLNFVSAQNPRPSSASSDILEWIGILEGTGTIEGNNYVAYADSGGVLTIGHGITVENNKELFRKYGIDPDSLTIGSTLPIDVVDAIYADNVSQRIDNVKSLLSNNGITLSDNQLVALVSLQFNSGNIEGFIDNYNQYGSSEALCTNWWEKKVLKDRKGNEVLKSRRIKECDMFVNGTSN